MCGMPSKVLLYSPKHSSLQMVTCWFPYLDEDHAMNMDVKVFWSEEPIGGEFCCKMAKASTHRNEVCTTKEIRMVNGQYVIGVQIQ